MAAKGTIKGDHIPVNKYQLLVAGLVPVTFTKISGIESELETVDLPDRTKATGGNVKTIEFTAEVPMHHVIEQTALEAWFREGQDPVSPGYKKVGTLVAMSNTGRITRSYSILGVFASKRGLPDFEMENEGEMAVVTWTFSADDILPLPV
jgi:hypothetical protein